MIESSRGFGRALLAGISKYSMLHGPWSFYQIPAFYRGSPNMKNLVADIETWKPHGIIMRETKNMKAIISLHIPTIVSTYHDEFIPGVANISVANTTVGKLAAEHLLDRGFKNFAFCGYDDMFWSHNRGEGFAERITEAGFQTYWYRQPKSQNNRLWRNEQLAICKWLQSLPKPVGVMTCVDERSLHVLEACKLAKLHCPDDVAIVGCDNDDMLCGLAYPPLSSIELSAAKGGYDAAELLDELMNGKKMAGQIVRINALHVVARQSTDVTTTDDRDVAEALRFIRTHSSSIITVENVVAATSLSRRVLEKRFRAVIGRSILDEIKEMRMEQIGRMLLETNDSITQIASKLGYSNIANLTRSFHHTKGLSPLEYRKRYSIKQIMPLTAPFDIVF